MTEIELRAHATNKTKEHFTGKLFDWTKSATCIHLARYHGKQMGHNLPMVPKFRSALTAKRKLKYMGHDSLPELLDVHFERIAPAMMRTGDVMAVEGDEGFHALYVKVSRFKYLGWHDCVRDEATGTPIFAIVDCDLDQIEAAWRL